MRKHYIRVKDERNIIHTISRRKANWSSYIWRRKCLLKRITEEKKEGGLEVRGR
jgi:hypothetical protein